jgi:hypothetical protein
VFDEHVFDEHVFDEQHVVAPKVAELVTSRSW